MDLFRRLPWLTGATASLLLSLAAPVIAAEANPWNELQRDVSSGEIVGLEVLVADGMPEPVYSRYGHALLRFIDRDPYWSNDWAVGFGADLGPGENPEINYLRGIFGGYGISAEIRRLDEFWRKYTLSQARGLTRYIVPVTRTQLLRLAQTLQAWVQNPSLAGRYTFAFNNCAGAIARLFEEAGFPHAQYRNELRLPTELNTWLERSLLSPYPGLRVQTPVPIFRRALALLGISIADLLQGNHWPTDSAERLMAEFNDGELILIRQEIRAMPIDFSRQIAARFKGTALTYDQVSGMNELPRLLYRICDPAVDCLTQIEPIIHGLWDPATLDQKNERLSFILRNATFETPHPEEPELNSFLRIIPADSPQRQWTPAIARLPSR